MLSGAPSGRLNSGAVHTPTVSRADVLAGVVTGTMQLGNLQFLQAFRLMPDSCSCFVCVGGKLGMMKIKAANTWIQSAQTAR